MKRLFLILLCCISTPLWAWGKAGHAAVASLAQARLTPAAQAEVTRLLADDLDRDGQPSGRLTLAAVASWADEIRVIAPAALYRGWHVRGNPVCSDKQGSCKDGHCVDQNIIHYAAILKDRKRPARERNEALKWVVHLVGDLHMPLHSGSNNDGSGGKIQAQLANGKTKTLHEYWDGDAASLALKQGPFSGTATPVDLAEDAPTRWMQEVRETSRRHVYDPMPGFACGEASPAHIAITPEYAAQARDTARAQIWIAGQRLAALLNEALGD